MHSNTSGIVLNKLSSKQCWRLSLITPDSGLITCFQRLSTKAKKYTQADLFDSASLLLKTARSGNTQFVEEYHLLRRRTSLATSYKNFSWATRFAKILLQNPLHNEASLEIYTLTQTAIDHWCEGKQGASIYFKALYRLVRLEGLPIKETWLTSLPPEKKEQALSLLNTPIQSLKGDEESEHKALASSLEQWMLQHTAIHC